MMKRTRTVERRHSSHAAGFTLTELLIATTVMTIIMGGTMTAMMHAMRATKMATLVTGMNANLRTGIDLMVRDLLQTGQDLPVGRVILIPAGGQQIRLPGPPTSAFLVPAGTTELSAVIPGPGLGPSINGVPTDMITFLAADSSFSNMDLTAISDTTMTVALPAANISGADVSNGGPDDLLPGQLIMLTKGSLSTLVQVTAVDGIQTATFGAGDSLRLNQTAVGLAGTLSALNLAAPATSAAQTQASRIRMISYYLDATNVNRPRLVRRINNGHETAFDNTLGTAVAFDIENMQITYDIANGVTNPSNVKMDADDLLTTGSCDPSACSPNQIRKVNVVLAGRSNGRFEPTGQFFHNTLSSQISLRSLSFVDKYTTAP